MKKNQKYEVHWIDTNSRGGWWTEEEVDEKAKEASTLNISIGFFIKYSHGYAVFATNYCPVENFNPYGVLNFIPIKAIQKTKLLK